MSAAFLRREVLRRREVVPRTRGLPVVLALVTITVLAVGGIQIATTRTLRSFSSSKVVIARAVVKKYAYEAYPSWSAEHPGQPCPRSLDQLTEFMNSSDTKDPWGNRYQMFCLPRMPPGLRPIAVMSFGEDGLEGTQDDIKSWEPR